MPGDISIPDKDRTMITIKWKELSSVNESLGIQLTLTGNQDKQKKGAKTEVQNFCRTGEQKKIQQNCCPLDFLT